jgi:WhiB family redox-sensing transcriptional regulator
MTNDLFHIQGPKFEFALCAESDNPDLWFPDSREDRKRDIPKAKKLCRDCVHRIECLEFALENDLREGVWGGLSERERSLLAPRRKNRNKDNQSGARGYRMRQQGKSLEEIGFILNLKPESVSVAIAKYVKRVSEEENE